MFGHYLGGRRRIPPIQCLRIAGILEVDVTDIDPRWAFKDTDLASMTADDFALFSRLMSLPPDLRRNAAAHIETLSELAEARTQAVTKVQKNRPR